MKFFLDASNLQEAQEAIGLRLADGISLNVLDLANDKNYCNFISEIADMLDGPIIVPTFSEKEEDIVKEAGALKRISENVCIQLPISLENLKICRNLVDDGFFIEMSLCFSVQQAILASKMGASFVSVALNKCSEFGINGISLAEDIKKTLENYTEFQTEVIIRHADEAGQIYQGMKIGIETCSASLKTLKNLHFHSITEQEIKKSREELAKIKADDKNAKLY